jgi:hypothetical protein
MLFAITKVGSKEPAVRIEFTEVLKTGDEVRETYIARILLLMVDFFLLVNSGTILI